MPDVQAARGAPSKLALYLRWTARGFVIAIAAFWLWFGIADGLYDAQSLGLMGFLMMLPAALICLAVLYVVWRWELHGGLLLLGLSALGGFFFYENVKRMQLTGITGFGQVLLGLSIFVLPFLLPAVLLLLKCKLDAAHKRSAQLS